MRSYIQTIGGYQEVGFIDKKSGFKVGILAGYGAGLNRFEIPFEDSSFNLVKGYDKKDDFVKLYNSVLLAPFPNRIKDGQYQYNGKSYQLPVNQVKENNAMHGFLFNQAFQIETLTTTKNEAHLSLKNQYQANYLGYPFSFACWVTYVWKRETGLTVTTKILNMSKQTIPVGLGWHPYFQFPSKVNDLTLALKCKHQYQVDDRMIPTLETKSFDQFQEPELIGNTTFDDCFALLENKFMETMLSDKKNGIELILTQETSAGQYPYLQIYTPKDRQSIALEPMTCIPNAFNNRIGLVELQPEESWEVSYQFFVSAR